MMRGMVEMFNVFSIVLEDNGIVKTFYPAKVKLVNGKLFMMIDGHLVSFNLATVKNLSFIFDEKVQL